MKTAYFTFGFGHVHEVNDIIFDKDVVVKITAEDPREKMFEVFGPKWCMQYDNLDDLHLEYFPRGIVELGKLKHGLQSNGEVYNNGVMVDHRRK